MMNNPFPSPSPTRSRLRLRLSFWILAGFLAFLSVTTHTAIHAATTPAQTPFSIPAATRQLIVALAPHWDDSSASLQRWEKTGETWNPVGTPIPTRLGKSGLAWGRGLHPTGLPGPQKKESDNRAPAGVFTLGGAYGYAPSASIPRKPSLSYHQVTPSDLWVEDTTSPDYNRHLRLPTGTLPRTDWEKAQQMKQNDPAHSLKLFIAHNAAEQTLAGAGSAIFFHIWRQDGAKPSSGCTVMPETDLKTLIAWVDPARNPLYVLLPREVYENYKAAWNLP